MNEQITHGISDVLDQAYLRGAKFAYENLIEALNNYQSSTNKITVPIQDLKRSISVELERISKHVKEF